MWQQARARLRNTDARLCVLVDCPSAGAWAQSLLAVPAAAAFASGIAVQASCRAGEMAWSQDIGGEAGGVFTSWYTRAEGHGQSPWSLAEAGGGEGRGEPLPCHGQVPCMACKFDDFSARRAIMCLGGEVCPCGRAPRSCARCVCVPSCPHWLSTGLCCEPPFPRRFFSFHTTTPSAAKRAC